MEFTRLNRLPAYALAEVAKMMIEARRAGRDVINLGMGNPDIPTPQHVVSKLKEAADKKANHRYSLSRGIVKLREAICKRYKNLFGVKLDPEEEAIVTLGTKEGLSHLVLALCGPGDAVLVPDPTYPIHAYSAVIAGADVLGVPAGPDTDFLENLEKAMGDAKPRPRLLIISFPSNPTAQVVDVSFFEKVVAFARRNKLMVIHDLAYADICFDGYRAPSVLEVDGARDVAVEFYSMSKGYSMPGWRVGFCLGNCDLIAALARIKSYLDYGMFQPIQIAATVALQRPDRCVRGVCEIYRRRRDVLCGGLARVGWPVKRPLATMFVWARIPEKFRAEGSIAFSKRLLAEAGVAVSPGVGFGANGEGCVRFALVENESRIRQAIRGIGKLKLGTAK